MDRPNKPARWQLDVWIALMIILAVLMMQVPIPKAWVTLVQIAWCVLTVSGMGLWVWVNRAALRQEEQEQHRKAQKGGAAAASKQPLARTLPLTQVQQHFLEATGQLTSKAQAAPQPVARANPPARGKRKRNNRDHSHATDASHTCAEAAAPARCRRSLTLIMYTSTALTTAGALLFLVLVGELITPFWSRVALVLYGIALALALAIARYRPSWRLLLYPLMLIALIYVWDSTLPPPSLPTGRVRLVLPLFALGWMVIDGVFRLHQVIRRAPRTIRVRHD